MSAFSKKINFVLIFSVNMANPNGDPLSENIPRTTIDGRGWCTSECIRRKIRNRLQDLGYEIYVKSDDRCDDGCKDLKTRAEKAGMNKITDRNEFYEKACWNWFDVRTFGQVFAFNSFGIKSIGVRGPVTNSEAFSVLPVDIESVQITKSTSGEVKDKERGSDTMGMKHFVRHGVYVVKGSVSVNLAEKTGFTEEEADVIKECLRTLFVNDASSARPEGSMEVNKLFWFTQDANSLSPSPAQVQRSVKVTVKPGVDTPSSIDDYDITVTPLEGVEVEEIDGI